MDRLVRIMTLWLWGGFAYYCIELAWRGWSHPSMYIVGGLCLLALGGINNHLPWEMPLILQCFIGAVAITTVELLAGLIINVWLGLGVWDYSQLPLNVMGQVCLWFCLAWLPLAAFGIWLDDFLRWKLFGEDMPHYRFL